MRIDLPDAAAFLPFSRQSVLDLCHTALQAGPILLTGDAGIGKTWLVDRLIQQVPQVRWVSIDLTPADKPVDLYRHLARGLGLATTGRREPSRIDVAEGLAERSADGVHHALVIDEAQNLSPSLWEEVRVLLNRFGDSDGFAHLLLVGQTPLVRQFATRALAAIEARLAAHLHLRPIDVAEARAWLHQQYPGVAWSADEVEAIHRDSGGNPSRLIRRSAGIVARVAGRAAQLPPARPAEPATLSAQPGLDEFEPNAMIARRPLASPPLTGPDRPPLHVEENSIEVGWAADDADSSAFDDDTADDESESGASGHAPTAARLEDSEQAVHDHYAALQAWREWAGNQEKQVRPAKSDRDLADEIDEAAAAEATDPTESAARERGSIRSEGYQHFAPFGQLFTRMVPVREP